MQATEIRYIYALHCPYSGSVKYVGMTSDPKSRLRTHCGSHFKTSPCAKWIGWLRKNNRRPVMSILQVVPFEDYLIYEFRWLDYYRAKGPMVNA